MKTGMKFTSDELKSRKIRDDLPDPIYRVASSSLTNGHYRCTDTMSQSQCLIQMYIELLAILEVLMQSI